MNKRASVVLVASFAAVFSFSCRDIGRGGTGEMVVPQKELREIRAIQPVDISRPMTRPVSTLPTTRSVGGESREVPLTLGGVRRLALENNLDLKVDVVTPAIARENLNEEEARYEWTFNTNASYASNDQAVANIVQQNLSGTESESWRITPG